MKARNKVDMLASLLAELEPKDIELLDYTYIKSGLVEVMHSIVKRANEKTIITVSMNPFIANKFLI